MEPVFSQRTHWPTATNRLHRLAAVRRAAGELTDLTVSNPTICGFTYPREALLAALGNAASLRYEPEPRGLEATRRAITAYYADYAERGVVTPPERLILTASTSEAYAHLFRLLCDAGDEVLMPAPSYPLFEMLAAIHDVRLIVCPMLYDRGWQLDRTALVEAATARTRALLLVHPNNPSGSYVKADEWRWAQAEAARRGWAVVVDEVFFDYPVAPFAPVELDLEAAPALTFVLNGLSKLAALPQMKLAWMGVHGPEPERGQALARLEVLNDLFLSAGTPAQIAAPAMLATRHDVQAQIRARIAENLAALDRALAAVPAVERLVVEGGWCVVLRLPRIHTDDAWAEMLVERAGVLVHPGHFYNFGGDGYLVASLLPPEPAFAAGIAKLVTTVAGELTP